jgi:hypothetical protein
MKNLILLLIIASSLSLFAKDKPKDKEEIQIPKQAWKIIIKNKLSSDDNFGLVGKTLRENNFTIETKDKESIKSGAHLIGRTSSIYYLYFSIKEGSIAISGQFNDNISGGDNVSKYYRILNKGIRGSSVKNAFLAMNNFALQLGGAIEYITD